MVEADRSERAYPRGLLAAAALLALGTILLAVSFYFVDDHTWYWNAAHVFSILGVLVAAGSGLLVGRGLSGRTKRRLWLLVPGVVLGLAWIVSGATAVGLAFPGMNYLSSSDGPVGWNSYHGDYLVGWYNIRLLQLAILTGLVGGFLAGLGLAPTREQKK